MKVLLIREGEIDDILIPPLITTIAISNNIHWPLDFNADIRKEFQKGTGFGSVKSAVQRLTEAYDKDPELINKLFNKVIIILDGKGTKAAQDEIKKMIKNRENFMLAIAIKEVEAWVLADRDHVIEWLKVSKNDCPNCRFWEKGYQPENDHDPKQTLSELVSSSDISEYDYWATGAANDFIEQYWKGTNYSNEDVNVNNWMGRANLLQMKEKCPRGFGVFYSPLISFLGK
ncbi:hypothetical protein MKY66_00985 [Paenibacillus sp. FSL R5-0766]|uniref:hypothetical protein n=1 Tax=unclassified Paenibacillus TaxID=185978 RepID=UPI00096E3AC2|nr:hypothetical protein [Paenibacillus sp. FSL R5-0765]OMF65944.1 hypothetical protein BK141_08910 [Paenibacillus sp. FSL R5-0765]